MTDFLLARPDSVLRARGVRSSYPDPAAARAALASGSADLVVGAFPFDPADPVALWQPNAAVRTAGGWRPAALPALPVVQPTVEIPARAEHLARVTKLIELIQRGDLAKVVAARSVELAADEPIDPQVLAAHLVVRYPAANVFVAPVAAGAVLVGATPELLVARQGNRVSLRPLAGTLPATADPAELLDSTKNQGEHAHVIEWIRDRLTPLCRELRIPDRPELTRAGQVWHLCTPIDGLLAEPAVTALDLVRALHPTPAVCGSPTDRALATITELEEPRGFYGGAVGWCDADGDGEWVVAIRCAELASGGRVLRAYAGGGIVADSDPQAELDETTVKLRTLIDALSAPSDLLLP
ncbi:isochorismate synthase MenF [Skermania piniformis]|uniref:isochorismate synthase n=1 Tax=Skermania pinensis TaxID=39122 RepID=A0ABX8S7G2_9ACTN|nr:isochorismate synthase [Skermania piniformis]QXQ13778.1 isochorismate synthase [Skermania piniformis]